MTASISRGIARFRPNRRGNRRLHEVRQGKIRRRSARRSAHPCDAWTGNREVTSARRMDRKLPREVQPQGPTPDAGTRRGGDVVVGGSSLIELEATSDLVSTSARVVSGFRRGASHRLSFAPTAGNVASDLSRGLPAEEQDGRGPLATDASPRTRLRRDPRRRVRQWAMELRPAACGGSLWLGMGPDLDRRWPGACLAIPTPELLRRSDRI